MNGQRCYTELQELESLQWQGIANGMAYSKIEGYRNDFENMGKVLLNYAEFLRTVAANIRKMEEDINNAAAICLAEDRSGR